ncbi:integrase (plasmid) [Roseobacter denitrificans]|uniref:Integrase, putative n=1 Tax=Roseobacter denitrificans (strain ATCC 33942 / OCh 114) TaxID=375451 RepID=Q07GR8_ROSDO|nr:tyrosine-type recombinase/integrase [Roseobacter denitrificans]ABI93331.1 integrase, putative [Roseobacter denitrificans OCh 114]AVL51205.1 integrase [Roseobacter denitrificans]SFG40845.1 Site-specific recombinase XerD [Roseobacter denitrificans OCh 114]
MTDNLINNGTKTTPEAEILTAASNSRSSDAQHDDTAPAGEVLLDIDPDELLSDPAEKEETSAQDIALPDHVAGSGSLDRLIDQARDYAEAATAENTNKAYKADWKHFTGWCRRKGVDALVPSPAVIGLYISDCAKPQDGSPALSVSTIERRLSGLAANYRQRGLALDMKDRHIASVWAGIKRHHAKPPTQKEAVLIEDVLAMVGALSYSLRDLRDRAILLIGYAGGLRRTEIVGLDVGKDESDDGRGWVEILEGGAVLHIKGKTGWREVEIGRGSADQTCPVYALEQWLHYAKIDVGSVFRQVFRDNSRIGPERLSDKHVVRLIKRLVLETGVGLDRPALSKLSDEERAKFFAGHSLRAGLASGAEVDERYVQKQLGHASAEMTRRYQRRRDRFRVNLTKAVGL